MTPPARAAGSSPGTLESPGLSSRAEPSHGSDELGPNVVILPRKQEPLLMLMPFMINGGSFVAVQVLAQG